MSSTAKAPLAQRLRPKTLADIVGQRHLLGENAPIGRLLANKQLPSLILYGEAGIGKTTLARLLADATQRPLHVLSAVSSGVKELRDLLNADNDLFRQPPVIFVDEIHRFNKAQQDSLLEAVESGAMTLIGATTENPSVAINHALLSRCQVYRLQPLTDAEIEQLLHKALKTDAVLKRKLITLTGTKSLCAIAHGDARKALNLLEISIGTSPGSGTKDDPIVIDDSLVVAAAGDPVLRFDKDGDWHYDITSALIKSVRGSDPDAAIYWLARLLAGGEDPAFIGRRLVILASEDIGLANPNALLLADAALRSVQSIGMPEARIILAQVVLYLATSPKSNSSYAAINAAMAQAENDQLPVPLHLRQRPAQARDESAYVYPHDHPRHYYAQTYLPAALTGKTFYHFGDNAKEQANWRFIRWLKTGD